MRSRQYLELRQNQQLALNQVQYQSLKLLQCSAAELVVEINKAIAKNPLLEKIETDDLSSQHKLDRYWSISAGNQFTDDIPDLTSTTSLTNYLLEQLRLCDLPVAVKHLVFALIGELDDQAYLRDLASWSDLNKALGINASDDQWEQALLILQSFDPIGVGARNLQESLKLQLQKQNIAAEKHIIQCAISLTSYLADAAAGKWQKLAKLLGTEKAVLISAYRLIQQLNPYPAADWDDQPNNYVIPDLLVYRVNNGWQLSLNPALGNNIRINQDLLADAKTADMSPEFSLTVVQAKNMLHNLQQRGQTILRVGEFLINYQSEFLKQGVSALRPLKLADVADALGLHISTVSRAIRLKYAQTPGGLIALKEFFAYELQTGLASYSPEAIQAMIARLIADENKKQPLSDGAISRALQDAGISIARRTISKYREKLGLASSYQRRISV